jgi:hypothetical protein
MALYAENKPTARVTRAVGEEGKPARREKLSALTFGIAGGPAGARGEEENRKGGAHD